MEAMGTGSAIGRRDWVFLGFTAILLLALLDLWRGFVGFLLGSGLYNYMVLIPVVSAYLLVSGRERIHRNAGGSPLPGGAVVAVGLVGLAILHAHGASLNANDRFSLAGASLIVTWIGGFAAIYGLSGFRAALFPLLFLILMVPIPSGLLEAVIGFLQRGSTEAANILFLLTGAPFFREGFTFHLPGITVEVAPQCSGIRSGISLFVTAILAGHLFLRTAAGKMGLALAVIPVTLFKNGVRIVSLTLLGVYVDPRILNSELHQSGGIPFFVVALLMMAPVLWGIRRAEGGERRRTEC
jgi:exosortase